jgi:hypothetical protein
MPVHKASGGWKWGKTGKVYRGKGAKKKAIKQALAVGYNSPGKVAHISHKGPTKLKDRKTNHIQPSQLTRGKKGAIIIKRPGDMAMGDSWRASRES